MVRNVIELSKLAKEMEQSECYEIKAKGKWMSEFVRLTSVSTVALLIGALGMFTWGILSMKSDTADHVLTFGLSALLAFLFLYMFDTLRKGAAVFPKTCKRMLGK